MLAKLGAFLIRTRVLLDNIENTQAYFEMFPTVISFLFTGKAWSLPHNIRLELCVADIENTSAYFEMFTTVMLLLFAGKARSLPNLD